MQVYRDNSAMDELEDFNVFLKKVDQINELVNKLKSSDEVPQKAMEEADCYLAALNEPCRTKVNKTTINKNPSLQPSLSLQNENPENFMELMEQDAEDRSARRASMKKATALKDKGNEAYAREDYDAAVKYYTEGLAELRDMQPLYTNRAQAFIKLGKYQEAISDCEWALKCNGRCTKAYLHMGKAYLALKNYNESRNCFERIVEIDPGIEKKIKDYLTQVDSEEKREIQEMNAMEKFDKGDAEAISVPQLLEKLSRPGQMSAYYTGGFEILSQAVTDCTGRTLFRLNNGFSIISSNDTVRSCLLQKTQDPDTQELCVSVLKLWRVICAGNDENQKMLMTCALAREAIVHLVTSEHAAVQRESLALLRLYSETPRGRRLATDSVNVHVLARNLMACVTMQRQGNIAANMLENFTTENKFCIQLRNGLTDSVIVPFTNALRNVSKSSRLVLPSLIVSAGRLARDEVILHSFARDPECWKAFLVAIKQCSSCEYREVLYPMLGLIINLSTVTSPVIQEHAASLCDRCLGLLKDGDGGVITRATGVLSTVLCQSSEAVQRVVQGDAVRIMCRLLKAPNGPTATKYAIKTLTVCTAASHLAREELLKSDKKLSILRHLLESSCDEMVSGNAALCLAHCLELEGTASSLLGTDIVPLLLRLAAGDAKRTAVQQNAAIALGKLCRSEPRHKDKLRELHGLEILHHCVNLFT